MTSNCPVPVTKPINSSPLETHKRDRITLASPPIKFNSNATTPSRWHDSIRATMNRRKTARMNWVVPPAATNIHCSASRRPYGFPFSPPSAAPMAPRMTAAARNHGAVWVCATPLSLVNKETADASRKIMRLLVIYWSLFRIRFMN